VLTEAVRQRPYSVVLLDEVEKADPEVLNLFYQVFDKGMLADGEGRVIDFKNTVIFMTSNLATDVIVEMCGAGRAIDAEAVEEAIRPSLRRHLKPALLARMTVVPFLALPREALRDIVILKLEQLVARVHGQHRIALRYGDDVVAHITELCTEVHSGARNIDHVTRGRLLPVLSHELLSHLAQGDLPAALALHVENGAFRVGVPHAQED